MGWNPFKSEEVTRVATSVSRVVPDASLPDSIKSGVIKAMFNDDSTIPDYTMDALVSSLGIRSERMYRYAEQYYTYGLPSGEVFSSTQGRAQVEAVIETMEHKQVSMEYSHYGTLNALHIGWTKLLTQHGYSAATNQLGNLTTSKGKPVYLKDMVVVVPSAQVTLLDPGMLTQWGTAACAGYTPDRPSSIGSLTSLSAPSPINISSTATDVYLLVTATWDTGVITTNQSTGVSSSTATETFTIDLSGYDRTANYFQAKYQVDGVTKCWLYLNGSGGYTALDQIYVSAPAVSGSYFPFTYFRFGKHSQISDKTTNAYKTSKRMLKHLGMDYDLLADSIDANPNIGDIEQAMMTFSVPAVSTNAIENRYLFDYFDNMFTAMDGSSSAEQAAVLAKLTKVAGFANWAGNFNTAVIQDARFRMTLNNSGIYKRLVAGSIGEVDSYASAYEPIQVEQIVMEAEGSGTSTQWVSVSMHRYRHQIAVGLYEEVSVQNLRMVYNIYGGYSTLGDGTSDILLIPIDRSVSENYSIAMREILYARSLHFIFNSRTVTTVKWYQQQWFSVVLIIVAIVLTVIDMGTDGGSWIATALGVTGTTAIVVTVIFNLIVGLTLMPKIFDLFVKVFGKEVAEALAILAIIYGAYTVIDAGGVTGAPWAKDLLMLSTGLESAVIRADFQDLLGDANELTTYIDDQTKTLDKAKELLANRSVLNPFVIFGEKPDAYYNRTVHFGNIGTVGINAISSYVDLALTLPKLKDTLGEELNDLSTTTS
jgi:hypothetical protein